jgi:transcriptional regulator with XRE-family HTH domain
MAQHSRPDGRPFTAADVAREAGVDEPAMSALLKNGGPLGREELFLILAWLNVSPAMWLLPEPVPAPRRAA